MANNFNDFMQETQDFYSMYRNELRELEMQEIYEDAVRDFSIQVE